MFRIALMAGLAYCFADDVAKLESVMFWVFVAALIGSVFQAYIAVRRMIYLHSCKGIQDSLDQYGL